jgi:hypothetical protein
MHQNGVRTNQGSKQTPQLRHDERKAVFRRAQSDGLERGRSHDPAARRVDRRDAPDNGPGQAEQRTFLKHS